MGRQSAAVEFSGAQFGPVSTFSVQAGKAKIVLSVLKNHASIRVRIKSVTPDLTEVGGTLEEAKALRQEHDELTLKLDDKQAEIIALLVKLEGKEGDEVERKRVEQLVKDAWKDIASQLEQRKALLDQSVAFHASALQFGKKMSQVEARCAEVPQAQDVETARRLIQQHQELKKSVLEASMSTLQEGQLLLDRIRRMAVLADVSNRHATTSGCYYIEQLLLNLQDRKRRLEELWLQRKFQLEQCIQLLLLDQDAGKVAKWLDEVGEIYLGKKDLGDSLDSANNLLNDCFTIEQQFLAAPQTVRRLIGAIEYLTHPVPAEKDGYRQRFVALDQRCESFTSRLSVRRKNVSLSAYFFALSQETLFRLEEIEVLLSRTDPGIDQNALAERHLRMSQSVMEASIAALHVGRMLLGRVGKDDPAVSGVNAKVTELQERCNKLQGLCSARPEPEKQPSEAITQLLDKHHKLDAWLKYVGQASIDRYSELGIGISDANDFLITHRALSEDFKAKLTEAKALVTSAEELAKSGDAVVVDVLEKSKKLVEQSEKFVQLAEKRSKIALAYVVLNRREQQLSSQLRLLEDHLKQEKLDPSLIPESAIKQREDTFKKVAADCIEIDRLGKQFLNDVNELKTADQLNTEFVTRGISLLLSNFTDRKAIVSDYFEHWKAYAVEGRTFSTQWKTFLQDARQTIDWVMKTEDNFFPKIAGELGSSLSEVQQHQKRLEDFKPSIKRAQEEVEKHLKTAELLALKGDTRGQRDQIVNELLKVHGRFQARIGEYRYLLTMATKFFENLQELDKLIATTEKEYSSEELPKDVSAAEASLRQHNEDKTKLKQLIEFSSEEADQIITRVRQQDSEEVAKDEVQRVLHLTEEKRKLWEKAWDDHKKRLEQCLQVSQFYFDLKQLQDELDEIQRQLDARQGSYGNSLASVKMIIQAFVQLEKLADLIGERFKDFVGTADKMIKDRHYDSRRIRHEVDETEKRWNTVYNTIKNYRIALEASTKFFNIMDECEGWINDAGQFLHGISRQAPQCKTSGDVDKLITQIQKYKQDGATTQDGRLNNMERIATDLYGSVVGPEKMQHILDKNQEMFNAFIKAIEDLMILRNNLINTEQILANVGAVVEKKAPRQPRFVQPLQNAEITEGQKFTFECRLECDTLSPVIQWLKDNEPVKGFVPSYKDGICRLTIEETMLRDSGSFVCKATTEAGSTETSAILKVKELQQKVVAPQFTRQLQPLEVPEGTSFLLECYVSGIPFPQITWFKDDAPISNSAEHLITIDGGCCYLKVRKLNKDHSGTYKCKATNPGGEAVSSATVNVISVKKPEFTQPLKDAKVDEGKSIRLECRYIGDPPPQIQWLFNDTPVLPSALFKIIVEENFTALEIHEVFPEDCGNYTATAKNLGGEARTTCLLSLHGVQPSVTATGKRPEFIQRLQRTDVQEGNRAKLECVVTGVPEPEVLWYHNDKPIKKSKDFDISYSNGRCSLVINEVYLEDSGEYLCTARNVHGMARTECRLVVEPLSDTVDASASLTGEVPPKFTQLLKDIEGVEGELVRFECRVIGFPAPVIKWYCGRNQLSSSPEFEITSENELQTLTIPTVHKQDAGNYMVKATNNAGIAKCYATLIVKEGGDKHAMKMRLIESSHSVQTNFIEGHRPPEVVKAFHDLHVKPGQPCNMEVVIVGTPKPKIQWLFNNEPIISKDYKISSLGDVHSLYIPAVFDEDAGRFSIIAENDAGKAWCSALLVVVDMSQLLPDEGSPPETPLVQPHGKIGYGPPPVVPKLAAQQATQLAAEKPVAPQFPEPLRNISVEEGFRATFEIPVSGKPAPLVRWFKDGRPLVAGTAGLEIFRTEGHATLTIPNVMERDAGRYTCTASNAAGEVSSAADLSVKASSSQPKFVQQLETQNVHEGEPVTFRVRVSGKPAPQVKWYRDGVEIVNSPDFVITQDGDVHTLYIPEVFKEDSGRFTVRVTNSAGQTESSANLIIEGPRGPSSFTAERSFDLLHKGPQFVRPLTNRTVQVGQRVTLECAIPPYPAPEKVQWFHNEIEIFISPQHQISYANGSCLLTIAKIVPDSRGKYACSVVVNGLSSTTDMNLDVIPEPQRESEIPQFTDKLRHAKYDEGQDVVFVCQVAGHPPPNIQWFHNGRLIRPSKKYEMKLTKDGVCSLRIKLVGPGDVGIYTCSATNVAGQQYSSAELYVADAKAVDETSYVSPEALRRMTYSPGRGLRDHDAGGVSEQFFKPVFRKIPNDLEVPEGHMARFDSVVAGRPIPDMLWFRDGTQVHDDRLHKIVINEEGINSLIIDATTAADAGLYTCIARNRAGEDSFQVRLNILPRQAAAPPRFTSKLNNQTVFEGQSVTFTIEVEGHPPPIISWQRDGCHITSSDHYQIRTEGYRSTLYIPVVTPEDNAWFQCTAASGGGIVTNRVRLIVQPGEPQITTQRTIIQSVSPAPRKIPTPVARSAPSPDYRQQTVNVILAPSPGPRASPWQQQQQYAEDVMSRTAVEMQTRRTEYPAASSEAAPQLIEPMKDQQVMEGVSTLFKCKIYSATEPRYEWFFNNRPIHPSHKHHFTADNGVYMLNISGITHADAGVYKCVVSNKGGEVTCIAHLRVGSQLSRLTPAEHIGGSQMPYFVKALSDITAPLGGLANFDVGIGGQTPSEVQWFLNGRPIQPSENHQVFRSNGTYTLKIKQLTPNDAGVYTCRVITPGGVIDSSGRLILQGPQSYGGDVTDSRPFPEIKERTVVAEIVQTRKVSPLPVLAAAQSPPEGAIIESSAHILHAGPSAALPEAVVEEAVRPVLTERRSIPAPDLSTISQRLEPSGVGHKITEVKGVTTVVEASQGDAPRFTRPIQPCVVVEGQSCTFSAIVVGEPWPEITWLKEKEDFAKTDRHRMTADATTGSCSLTIVNCQPTDTGVYSCRATNVAGRATCTANIVVVPPNVEVTVTEKTTSVKKEKVTTMGDKEIRVVENSPTFKEALPPVVEVNEGEPVRLQCQIAAEPEPNVSWFFNGNRVTSTHRVTVTFDKMMTVLAIPSTTLADTGEYICTARNPLGEAHTKTFLKIKKLDKEPVPVIPAPQPSSRSTVEPVIQPIVPGSAVEVSLPIPPMALTEPCSVIPLTSPKPESPKFLVPLRNQTVREGDSVRFNVEFTGNPAPNITWYMNGRPVQEDGDFQVMVDVVRGESILTIREVFSDDEGEFTCKAVNSVGTALSNSHLFVVVSSDEERSTEEEIVIQRELRNIRNQQETIIINKKPRPEVIEFTLGSNNYQSTLETNLHTDDSEIENHFIPIHVREKRDKERTVYLERNTREQRQFTEVFEGGERPMFSETIAIDASDQNPETLEFELKPEKQTKLSELVVHTEALPKGMKMEHLLLLERSVKKHEISEALLAPQIFSETVAIDTSDHKTQTLEFQLKQLRSSELLVHQKALPKGMRLEAEILESLKKTSRLDLSRSKLIEAIENQRQELLLNLEGSPPKFIREIESQKVMDGDKMKFYAKVIGNPMPEDVMWFHDGKIIADNPDFHMEYDKNTGNASLFIEELFPQDAGSYTCLAKNIYGQAMTTANLTVDAYEYIQDSEQSYASQTESNISTSSAMESLQKVHAVTHEYNTQIKQEVQIEKITERREEEHINIADVKWCKPLYTEPTVEIVKHENFADLTVESHGMTVNQTSIPQVTTQISVQASKESRIHPLQESTTVEEVREFDYTDSGESRLKESQNITSPLASPPAWKKLEARVSVQLERFREEGLTSTNIGMATPETLVSLAISELEKVKLAKTIGTVFVKPGQLPAQPIEVVDAIRAILFESGKTEQIQSSVDTAKAKDIPSSWVLTLTSKENPENVEHLREEAPTLHKTKEEEISNVLIKTSSNTQQSLTSQVVEVHSEGEEEELFHEAVEPSLRGETIAENLVNILVQRRPFNLSSPLVTHQEIESTGAKVDELIKETPHGEEVKLLLESISRSVPTPTLVSVIQERTSPERLLQDEESKWMLQVFSTPKLVTEELEKTKREDIPVNWVSIVEDRLSPEKTVIHSNTYDEQSLTVPKPELIKVELGSTSLEKKPISRVQTIEDRLRLEATVEAAASRVDDLSMILPVPEVIQTELSTSSKNDKPVTRTRTVEDRTTLLSVSELVKQPAPEEVCQESLTVSDLEQATVKGGRPSMVRILEEKMNLHNTTGFDSQVPGENTTPSVIEYQLVSTISQPQPFSLVQVTSESTSHEDVESRNDEKDVMVSVPEMITLELVSTKREEKLVSRATVIDDRLSPEKTVDVKALNLDDLLMVLSSGEIGKTEFVNSQMENEIITRVGTAEEKVPSETMSENLPLRAGDMAMTLPTPELISSEYVVTSVEGKIATRVLATEQRLSPDRVTHYQALNLNDLALTLSSGQVPSTQFATSTKEDELVTRTLVCEDVNAVEDVAEAGKQNLANLIMVISAGDVESVNLVPITKEGKPVTQAVIQEERSDGEKVSERQAIKMDEFAVTLSGSKIVSVELESPVLRDRVVSKVVPSEHRAPLEDIQDGSWKGTDDIAFTVAPRMEPSVEFESKIGDHIPVNQTRMVEEHNASEGVTEKKMTLDELMISAFSSLFAGAELASALREFLLSQVQLSEEQTTEENFSERCSSVTELLVSALSTQISAADLAFAVRESLLSQVKLMELRMSPERVIEKSSDTKDLAVSTMPSQILAEDLSFALREKLVSQVRMMEERMSPERTLEKSTNTAELLMNALSSQISAAELAFAVRDKLISQVRYIEERKSPERVTEKTSSTEELLVSALLTQISAAEFAYALRERLISQVRFIEERTSPERVSERSSDTSELVMNAMSSQIPYIEMTPVNREIVLSLVKTVEERKSPEKIIESTNYSVAGLAMSVPFAEQVGSELTWGMMTDKEPTRVQPVVERTSPEKFTDGISDKVLEESGWFSEVERSDELNTFIRKHRSHTLVLPQVIRLHVEATGKLESPTNEREERSFETQTQSTLGMAAVNECPVYMNEEISEDKEVVTEITYTMKKEPERKDEEFVEQWTKTQEKGPSRKEITTETEIETEMIEEEWEVIDRRRSAGSPSETRSLNEVWEETTTAQITTERDINQENLSETGSFSEEWEEMLTTETTTERDSSTKVEPETESLHEEWEETITKEITTETDITTRKEEPKKEDLLESTSMYEEWEETLKTTTITEKDVLIENQKPEHLSETESLHEEWEETLKTETTTEVDVFVERTDSDHESLSETQSMHEEWEETKKTITIVEKDVIFGEIERTKVDLTGYMVCKEIKQGKETEETKTEGMDVADSSIVTTSDGQRIVETQTVTRESGPISKEQIEFRSNIPLVLPTIEMGLQPLTVIDGSKATLACRVVGYPVPEIKWYVDGMEIKQSSDFKMTYENGFCTLVINDVLPEDEGEYCVKAANAVGTCKTSAYLKVKRSPSATTSERQKGKPGKPRHSSSEEMYSSGEESYAARTIEEHKVFDEFNKVVVDVSLKRKGIIDSKYEWLQEQSARQQGGLDRSGLGKDEFDYGFSQTGYEVTEGQTEYKQVVTSSRAAQPPVFITQLESRDVFESTPVKLECDVKGFPQPEISWYQDGKKIQPNDHMKLSYNHGRCTLQIDRVTIEDEAEYVCEARNEHGVATTWAELLVEKLIEGLEQLVMEEFYELEIEMQFKWKPETKEGEEQEATA